jgi:hypothetical protein
MIYCETCGAANDALATTCNRCGTSLSSDFDTLSPAASPVAVGARAIANEIDYDAGAVALTAELQLPSWLRDAAAETPHDPATAAPGAAQFPPAGFVVEPPPGPVTNAPVANQPTAPAPEIGRPTTVAQWPRDGGQPLQTALAGDLSDTSSFISETDLPDWIRQIAAADAAKKTEEQRKAAADALAASGETKRVVLPGEESSAGQATNLWLTRRETPPAPTAWLGTTAAAPLVAAPMSEAAAPPATAIVTEPAAAETAKPAKRGLKLSLPAFNPPSTSKAKAPVPTSTAGESTAVERTVSKSTRPKVSLPSLNFDDKQLTMRLALIGGIGLLVVVLLIAMVL